MQRDVSRAFGPFSIIIGGRTAARRLIIVLTITLAVAIGVFPAQPARATVTETPLSTDSPDHPVGTFGRVNDIAVVGNIAYLGGNFSSVGGETRNNLAAINLNTGNVTGWNPNANGIVYAVTASPDGSLIYAGGSFSTVGGTTRRRLAALNASNANVTSWNPVPSATVESIDVDGNTVYIGGNFQDVGGTPVRYAAAVNATTGNADSSFDPNPNGSVNVIAVAPDGDTVYLGGNFSRIDGTNRPNAGAVNPANGNVTSWNPDAPHVVLDLAVSADSSQIFLAIGGPWSDGGNLASAHSAANGATLWSHQSDGDLQAVAAANDRVYFGGHFYLSGGAPFNKLVSYNPATGARDNNWAPGANSAFGIWALTYAGNRLLVGGDFSQVGGVNQAHFAVFPGNGGGNQAPGATFNWSCDGLTCAFDASAAGDTDGVIVDYEWVFDDGSTGSGVTASHPYAFAGTYTVRLTVTDNDGATDSTTRAVTTTNQEPTAAITVSCTYLSCTLDGTASTDPDGVIVDYDWNVGDATTSDESMPSHTYGEPGTYTVELTVTDNGGATDSAITEVTVAAAPVHVHDLAPQPEDLDGSQWLAVVAISVRDVNEDPVVGATVEGFFGQGKVRTCTTAANGKCKVKVKVSDAKNRIPWEVTGIAAAGAYAPATNHDAVGADSDGTIILVWQP